MAELLINHHEKEDCCTTYVNGTICRMVSSIGRYRFRNAVPLMVYLDEDSFVHMECETADLFAVGETEEEAYRNLIDELDFAWEAYVKSNKSTLHDSALAYRDWLLDNLVVSS